MRATPGQFGRMAAIAAVSTIIGVIGGAADRAQATEGYFQHGYGPRQQALAGTGVADPRDAMALSINPAGGVYVGREFQLGVSVFAPFRGYTATGPGFVAPGPFSGDIESSANFFLIPNIAYNHPLGPDSAFTVALFGNGGMNTTYNGVANLTCGLFGAPAGVFCGGDAGVNLNQAFLTFGYSHRIGVVSVGVAPVLAVQMFEARGLSFFAPFSSNPASLTDNGNDWSFGAGLRGGIQVNATNWLRFGATAQTEIYMTKFSKYSGLFADGGSFNIPANFTVGAAFDVMPNLTFLVDYKHIFYSSIPAVGNSGTAPALFGAPGGPGFGWRDVDIIAFGAEWRATPDWTLRIGYAHNTNPITSEQVTLNILAPGVVTDHFTGGFNYKVNANSSIDFAASYMPTVAVSGIEVTPGGANPARTIELAMHQYQFTLGWKYQFAPDVVVTKY